MKRMGAVLIGVAVATGAAAWAQTNQTPAAATSTSTVESTQAQSPPEAGQLIRRVFRDYTIMLVVKADEPWQGSWNDPGEMGVISNPSNNVVITCQFLKFPLDPALEMAAGNRDQFMDIALRKYCATVFTLNKDPEIASQPVNLDSRTLGDHYFRYCPIWGRDRTGGRRRGFFYIMLRGSPNRPQYTGDTLILTIGYPDLIASADEQRALKTFDIALQNVSFY